MKINKVNLKKKVGKESRKNEVTVNKGITLRKSVTQVKNSNEAK